MGAGMRALAAALLLLATAAPAAADVAGEPPCMPPECMLCACLQPSRFSTPALPLPPFTASHHGGGAWSPWYTSPLWGKAGELWTPAGRLADWSMAGYGGDGRTPLPVYRNTGRFDITRFGASPAPGFDNAPAVQAAIAAAGAAAQRERCGQVVYIPPGQWWINQTVFVNVSHVALRGAGVGGAEGQAGLRGAALRPHAAARACKRVVTTPSILLRCCTTLPATAAERCCCRRPRSPLAAAALRAVLPQRPGGHLWLWHSLGVQRRVRGHPGHQPAQPLDGARKAGAADARAGAPGHPRAAGGVAAGRRQGQQVAAALPSAQLSLLPALPWLPRRSTAPPPSSSAAGTSLP